MAITGLNAIAEWRWLIHLRLLTFTKDFLENGSTDDNFRETLLFVTKNWFRTTYNISHSPLDLGDINLQIRAFFLMWRLLGQLLYTPWRTRNDCCSSHLEVNRESLTGHSHIRVGIRLSMGKITGESLEDHFEVTSGNVAFRNQKVTEFQLIFFVSFEWFFG